MENSDALRVLVVSSSPLVGTKPLDLEEERKRLREAFGKTKGNIEVHYLPHATVKSIQEALLDDYDVFHFVGLSTEKGELVLEQEDGNDYCLPGDDLAGMLKDSGIKLAVLIACYSYSDAVSEKLEGKIPSIIGVRKDKPLPVVAGSAFTSMFYTALAKGKSVNRSFEDGKTAIDLMKGLKKYSLSKLFVLTQKEDNTLITGGSVGNYTEIEPVKTPCNLPKADRFLGRIGEMVAINKNLKGKDNHIINLHGVAGIGKTALALEAARWQKERGYFKGGVFWHSVELNPTLSGLLESISNAFEMESTLTEKEVLGYLNKNDCLLVIDNFQTVLDLDDNGNEQAEKVIQFLQNIIDSTHVLITSRRNHIGLRNERDIYLGELPIEIAKKLFIEIVGERGWKPGKEVPDYRTNNDITNICELLGCVPLAIVLSAPLLHTERISVGELYERLKKEGEMHNLLDEDKRAVPRLKDYKASLLLSYSTLKDDAKYAFAVMSIFSGWTGEEAVKDIIPNITEIFEKGMHDLERKNLIRCIGEGKSRRWQHLPIIKSFAFEKLKEYDIDIETLKLNHANYYLKIAEKYEQGKEHLWKFLDPEWDNITSAADFISDKFNENFNNFKNLNESQIKENKIVNLTGEYALALKHVAYFRHLGKQGERWLKTGLEAFNLKGDEKRKSLMCNQIGLIHDAQGDYPEAIKWYNKSMETSEKISDTAGIGAIYNNIASIHYAQGNYPEALKWYNKSLEIKEKIGDTAGLATTYNNIGLIHDAQGNYPEALKWYNKSLEIKEKIGDIAGFAATYNNIAAIHYAQGNYSLALKWYNKSREIMEKIGNTAGLAATYNNIGEVHRVQGNYPDALKWFNKSGEISEKIGNTAGLAATYNNIAAIHYAQGDYPEALKWYNKSWEITEKIGDTAGLAATYNNIGEVHRVQGNYPEALRWYKKSAEIKEKIEDSITLSDTYIDIGNIHYAQGNYSDAEKYYYKGFRISKDIGIKLKQAEIGYVLGKILLKRKNTYDALEVLKEVKEAFKEIHNKKGLADTCLELGNIYQMLNDYEMSRWLYKDALRFYKDLGDLSGEAVTETNLGRLEIRTNLFSDAEKHLKDAYKYFVNANDYKKQDAIHQLLQITQQISKG
ncbi:hypothetical protein BEH94_10835 [Candidatus Altiarchaeales archaeon WOR_SM1_SCG]|nr:hypothetical protein BEH94_10835 [Candidatus Altiarchaeales archaeon WOR_SM1_SCG]